MSLMLGAMQETRALNIKQQYEKQKAAFFFKQWGTWGDGIRRNAKDNGASLG